ncbi:unnamed protein product [marine sediment metagenome]|uniref:Uncharacterized protein n=1 Tax=marine sediment metagenome TaxID=412755 RepID=X1G191_9ZZZZ
MLLPNERTCWIPIVVDIAELSTPLGIPSILGNDVMQFGVTTLAATNYTVKIELWLHHPVIT